MVVLSAMSHCRNAKKYYTKDKNQSATDVRLQGSKPKPSASSKSKPSKSSKKTVKKSSKK